MKTEATMVDRVTIKIEGDMYDPAEAAGVMATANMYARKYSGMYTCMSLDSVVWSTKLVYE